MLLKLPITFLLVFTVSLLGFSLYNAHYINGSKYVGVKTCGMCHKKKDDGQQLKIWQDSKHSKAYTTLKTEEADKIAKEKGYSTKAVETQECLQCHVTGYDIDASMLGNKFKIEDGVQCETCHGPGSDYKSKKVMQNRKLSIEKGLLVFDNPEELCVKCHNEESPAFTGFNFDEMWAKIKHSKPQN
jgi:excinuclease UvrABC ATPase subunit